MSDNTKNVATEERTGEASEYKTLDYYIEHPHEMPTDPEVLDKLFEDYQEKQASENAGPKAEPQPEVGEPQQGEQKPEGVLAKDGKHVIPYAEMERRLNEARDAAAAEAAARKAAEEQAAKLAEQLRELSERVQRAQEGGTDAEVLDVDQVRKEIEKLAEEFPQNAQVLDKTVKLVSRLYSSVERLERALQAQVTSEVDELVEQVPDLREWRKSKPLLFDLAKQFDEQIIADKALLQKHPEFLTDDLARYHEVVRRVKEAVGLPLSSPETKTERQKADEIVAAASAKIPTSLSQIPAGQGPASTPTESVENLSAAELGNRFMQMTPEQIQAQLSRL